MRKANRREGSYTLIELAAVVVIIGVAATLCIMKLDHFAPGARLRAGSRLVGTGVELALSDAAMKGEPRFVVYDLGAGAVRMTSSDGSKVLWHRELPRDVEIVSVEGIDMSTDRTAELKVFPSGRTSPHVVRLRNATDEMTVEVYGLTGRIRYE